MSKNKDVDAAPLHGVVITPHEHLWGGKSCDVPRAVAVCLECGHSLHVSCNAWDEETGQPHGADLQIDCENEKWFDDDEDKGFEHRWFQSDWQSVVDAVRKWADATTD